MPETGARLSWLPTLELILAGAAGALWYTQGGWVWYRGPGVGAWPLVLIAALWGLRLLWISALPSVSGRRRALRPAVFTGPLILFALSAAVGLWAAYDPALAWAKIWLIIAALGLYWAMAHQPDLLRIHVALALWSGFILLLTVYFVVVQDWEASSVGVPLLATLSQAVGSRLPESLIHRISPNVAGGMLALLLPLTVPLIALARRPPAPDQRRGPTAARFGRGLFVAAGVLALLVGLAGCLVTFSRGAWIALATAAALWAVWRLSGALGPRRRLWVMGGLLLAGGVGAGWMGLLALRGALPDWLPSALSDTIRADLANRLRLLQLGGLLVRDTPFTGIGLGVQEMHLSVYTLLIHVGYLEHLHNTVLDMGIEQSLLGAAAYVGMLITALVWGVGRLQAASMVGHASSDDSDSGPHEPATTVEDRMVARQATLVVESALAAIVVMVGHGLVDDTVYGSRGLLLLFVPFGLLVASGRLIGSVTQPRRSDTAWGFLRALWPAGVVLGLLLAMALGLARGDARQGQARDVSGLDTWKGRWYANLGAVAQARTELSVYDQHRFSELPIDDVRQQVDLARAVAHFEHALAFDPANPTARQRLTSIHLARGDYAQALASMQVLWEAGYRDRITRLLYGDALVAAGRVDEAVEVVRGLEFAEARLLGQAWSRYTRGDDPERAAYAYEAAARLSGD